MTLHLANSSFDIVAGFGTEDAIIHPHPEETTLDRLRLI
jgi:hypothetical protein